MISNPSRELNEIEHGKKLVHDAEKIWGWNTPAGRIRAKRRADFFINFGNITSSSRVLEIGCGTGFFTKMVAETNAQITAIDISRDLVEIAKTSCSFSNVKFVTENIHTGDKIQGPFDIIYGSSILHHLDLKSSLPVIIKNLKSGGKIIFTEPNLLNPQIWLERKFKFFRNLLNVSPDETAFIKNKLKKDLAEAGFVNIRITPFDWLHPFTPKPIIPIVEKIGFCLERLFPIKEISGSLLILAEKN